MINVDFGPLCSQTKEKLTARTQRWNIRVKTNYLFRQLPVVDILQMKVKWPLVIWSTDWAHFAFQTSLAAFILKQ